MIPPMSFIVGLCGVADPMLQIYNKEAGSCYVSLELTRFIEKPVVNYRVY
jgi:hypothetical protein